MINDEESDSVYASTAEKRRNNGSEEGLVYPMAAYRYRLLVSLFVSLASFVYGVLRSVKGGDTDVPGFTYRARCACGDSFDTADGRYCRSVELNIWSSSFLGHCQV